jgi:hypothetical protein
MQYQTNFYKDMTRFSSRKADGYEDVVEEIKNLSKNNFTKPANPRLEIKSIQSHSG